MPKYNVEYSYTEFDRIEVEAVDQDTAWDEADGLLYKKFEDQVEALPMIESVEEVKEINV